MFRPNPMRRESPQQTKDCKRKEQADESHGQQAVPLFSAISYVDEAEGAGQQYCRPPEPHGARQRELSVAAQQKFLEAADQQEHHGPERSILHDARPVQGEMSEVENVYPIERH